jgi:hypothetical protein
MKKTALSLTLILMLLVSTAVLVNVAKSAPTYTIPSGPLSPPVISMESPTTTTYVSWFVPLKFSVEGNWNGYVDHCTVSFSLDGGSRLVIYDPPTRLNGLSQNFMLTMGPLSEGIHRLQVFAIVGGVYRTDTNALDSNDFTSQMEVYFTVNTLGQAQLLILSPLNQTYNSNKEIPVEFNVNKAASIVKMGFSLDDQSNVTIPRNTTLYGPVSDGQHKLKVYAVYSDVLPVYSVVNFTIDTTAPNITILSLKNKEIYRSSEIALVFEVNETTSLMTYILDGKVHTISGNLTLSILQDGDHTLTVYATDQFGNAGASETIDFKVLVPVPSQIALAILPPLATVLIGGLSLLIYFEKRKQSAMN